MLTKLPIRTFVPGQRAIQAQNPYTNCPPGPVKPPPGGGGSSGGGQYVRTCEQVCVPVGMGSGSIAIGGGNNGSPIYDCKSVCRSVWVPG